MRKYVDPFNKFTLNENRVHTLDDAKVVLDILQKNDVKNLNGGKLRLETVMYNHYKK